MIKIFVEPEATPADLAAELAQLHTELEQLRQQLTDRQVLFGNILTSQQKIQDMLSLDTSKTAESRLLIDEMRTMLNALSVQMAEHLQQLSTGCTQQKG